jgi:muramoyltetrapeptide carboxypeptidase
MRKPSKHLPINSSLRSVLDMAKQSRGWKALQIGDTVDVIAPGFRTSLEHVENARKFLESLGLVARIPSDLFGDDVIASQTDEIRFKHLKNALLAKDSKAVWCLRGGYGAIRLLERLKKIKPPKNPKIVIGYSDVVSLHNFLNQFWQWPTLHGPLLDRLGQHTLEISQVNECLDTVFGRIDSIVHDGLTPLNTAAKKVRTIKGRVFGGNLIVTQSHLGTPFAKIPKDAILIFEDIGERGYRVDRVLVHLSQAGYFKNTRAIIFGDFIGGAEQNGEEHVTRVIDRFARESKIPVYRGLKVGHGNLQRVVPLNTSAVLDGQCVLRVKTGVMVE